MSKSKKFMLVVVLAAFVVWKINHDYKSKPNSISTTQAAKLNKSSANDKLIVTGVTQTSNGLTANDITPHFVSNIEKHFVEESKKQYQTAMKEQGHPNISMEYTANTVIYDEGGEKLAVTTLKPVDGSTLSKIAWWISDGEIRRVVCIDTEGNEIPVRFGLCGAKISEVFGKHWALDSKT